MMMIFTDDTPPISEDSESEEMREDRRVKMGNFVHWSVWSKGDNSIKKNRLYMCWL